MQKRVRQPHRGQRRAPAPGLMDFPRKPDAGGHPKQADQPRVLVFPGGALPHIAADNDIGAFQFPVLNLEEPRELRDILVQPLVRVYGQVPRPPAAVHHGVPGSGEIVGPGKVQEDVRVFFRDLPAAVIGPGICHDQLAGERAAQGLQGFQAPLQAPAFIFENHTDGQKRFLFHGVLLSSRPWKKRLGKPAFPKAGKRGGLAPAP